MATAAVQTNNSVHCRLLLMVGVPGTWTAYCAGVTQYISPVLIFLPL